MSEYFSFYNDTRGEKSRHKFNGVGLEWATKILYYDSKQIEAFFKDVILANKWNINDEIFAISDSSGCIYSLSKNQRSKL